MKLNGAFSVTDLFKLQFFSRCALVCFVHDFVLFGMSYMFGFDSGLFKNLNVFLKFEVKKMFSSWNVSTYSLFSHSIFSLFLLCTSSSSCLQIIFKSLFFSLFFKVKLQVKSLNRPCIFFNVYLFLFYFFGWYHAFVYRNKIPIKYQSVSSIILISCSNMIVNLERPIMVYVPSTLH